MTTLEIGKQLVDLCSKGENAKAIDTLYSKDIVSVEATSMPNMPAEMKGIDAVKGKNQWWYENHTVHSASCTGPFPHGDRFIVRFTYDVTFKPANQRMKMDEMALFTVKDDKIVKEEFFYTMG